MDENSFKHSIVKQNQRDSNLRPNMKKKMKVDWTYAPKPHENGTSKAADDEDHQRAHGSGQF